MVSDLGFLPLLPGLPTGGACTCGGYLPLGSSSYMSLSRDHISSVSMDSMLRVDKVISDVSIE